MRWVLPLDLRAGTYTLVARPGRISGVDWAELACGAREFALGRVSVTAAR